jgi:peptide/nickel transport system permease protein
VEPVGSGTVAYAVRRLVGAVPLLLGLSVIMFSLVHLAPGDPIESLISPDTADASFIEQARKNYGLDQPLPIQYLAYVKQLATGDFGLAITFNRKPVLALIRERAPATIALQAASLGIALLIAVPLGVLSATRQYSFLDNAATLGAFIGLSMPSFWLALLMQFYLSVRLGWLPAISTGVASAGFWGRIELSIMPIIALALPSIAYFARFVRSAMLDVFNQDYMTVARAKGLTGRQVLFRHGLRNTLIPMITITGLQVARILGGAVIIEKIFAWPGLGALAYDAVAQRDYPVILGVTIVSGAFVILVSLFIDLLYVVADPRMAAVR